MTAHRINILLQTSALAVAAAAVLALIAGLLLPLESTTAGANSLALTKKTPTTQPSGVPPLEQFSDIWSHPLRRALTDPLPEATPATPAVDPNAPPPGVVINPPPMTLVGTVGTSLAMLQTPDGSVWVKSVGESQGGVEVTAVRDGHVDLRFNGRHISLDKPIDPTDNASTYIHPADNSPAHP